MTIFLEDTFDSAHWLPNVPPGHKCATLHGHTYRIRIEVSGEVIPVLGWVMDYAEIKGVWSVVKGQIDHKPLNEIKGLENSTCENLVRWIWARLKIQLRDLSRIEIRETANCGVVYAGEKRGDLITPKL